jgi:hypothetical protein
MTENDTVFDLPYRLNKPGQAVMNGEHKNLERVAVLEAVARAESPLAAHRRK